MTEEHLADMQALPAAAPPVDENRLLALARGMMGNTAPPARRGRPPGSRNKPKDGSEPGPRDVGIDPEISETASTGARRRRTSTRSASSPVTPKQVADLMVSSHLMAAALVGPAAMITPEQGQQIGDALVPVLEDYGVVVASKVLHLVMLLAAVAMVEGPVAINVMTSMRERAKAAAAQRGSMTATGPVQQPTGASNNGNTQVYDAAAVARALGVELGQPA